MATRIGGPMVGATIPPCTWASMRSPLLLNLVDWGQYYSRFSRAYPLSDESPPKFFKWDAGYLFRREPWPSGVEPYQLISNFDNVTRWYAGTFYSAFKSIDNTDFKQLIGEVLDTDIGSFTITADAHISGQVLQLEEPVGTEVYAIGKLTGF